MTSHIYLLWARTGKPHFIQIGGVFLASILFGLRQSIQSPQLLAMFNSPSTILYWIAIAIGLVGCDANRVIQPDGEKTSAVENLNLKEFEPSPDLRKKAKQYAKRAEKNAGTKSSREHVNVTYGDKKSPTLAFESQQKFKAYQQVKERISKYEGKSLHIQDGLQTYEEYPFVSKGELHALNHKKQVVINDTLYRFRGKKQIAISLGSGEKEVTMLSEMLPNPPEIEHDPSPPSERPTPRLRRKFTSKDSTLGQCVEITGWKNSYNSVEDTGDPCYTGDRQTRYYPQRIDLPDDALSYAGDPITGIRVRPVNTIGSGDDGFLGQTNRIGTAHSKVVLLGRESSYQLGVDNLDANKLSGDVVVDISMKISEESCYFGYCYCTSSNITNDERRVIAETDVGTDFRPINTTGSNAGPYAVSAYTEDRCGGKGVTSWHGIEIDGRQYPTYYDGRLFTQDPASSYYFLRENSDPIYKLRGGCGSNNQNCGARPESRL